MQRGSRSFPTACALRYVDGLQGPKAGLGVSDVAVPKMQATLATASCSRRWRLLGCPHSCEEGINKGGTKNVLCNLCLSARDAARSTFPSGPLLHWFVCMRRCVRVNESLQY